MQRVTITIDDELDVELDRFMTGRGYDPKRPIREVDILMHPGCNTKRSSESEMYYVLHCVRVVQCAYREPHLDPRELIFATGIKAIFSSAAAQ